MTPQTLEPHDDRFKAGLTYSLGFHAVLLAVLVVRAVFYPHEALKLQHAIRVDMVSLPDKTPQKLPSAPAAAEPPKPVTKPADVLPDVKPDVKPQTKPVLPKTKPVEPPKKAISLKHTAREQSAALKRLEAMSRLEKLNKQETATAAAKTATERAAEVKAAVVKGNVLSAGSSLSGLSKAEHDDYIDSLDQRIKDHWNLPAWLANANFKARVTVYLDSRGVVIKKVLSANSGNAVFNEKCMAAIDQASPFPPPPARLVTIFAVDGFEVGFPE
jgi:colicin import membrane protein